MKYIKIVEFDDFYTNTSVHNALNKIVGKVVRYTRIEYYKDYGKNYVLDNKYLLGDTNFLDDFSISSEYCKELTNEEYVKFVDDVFKETEF